ncbi:MAG: hypothetical protein K2N51_08490 [Lachnospiraceae bacterium]|nr:hypothetical protein [Lachnospiraceae bacterium]
MKYIEKLYQQISNIGDQEFYLMEPEFCHELYNHISDEKKPLCVIAFLTIANWFAMSQRSGVWTFYEGAYPDNMDLTLQYLEQTENDDLAGIFRYGIHDYQNPQYAGNYNYPKTWIDESEKIDKWIGEHEEWLFAWERKLLIDNKELICSLIS